MVGAGEGFAVGTTLDADAWPAGEVAGAQVRVVVGRVGAYGFAETAGSAHVDVEPVAEVRAGVALFPVLTHGGCAVSVRVVPLGY